MSDGAPGAETTAAARAPAPRARLVAARVLIASHGTEGARAAEAVALDAVADGGSLHHLVIVPDLWRHMTGDGWRIDARTEHQFCDYLEGQIERENREQMLRVFRQARARGVSYAASSRSGPLEDCLIAASREEVCDLVVIGAPRPKGTPGLRSRLRLDRLAAGLAVPLLVVPHPGR